jgi:hypothetical protein
MLELIDGLGGDGGLELHGRGAMADRQWIDCRTGGRENDWFLAATT